MIKYWATLCFLCFFSTLQAQTIKDSIDLKYLEDQLYIAFTYNILINKPATISQNGFSGGVSFGFIKDIPLNKNRNFGLGIGAGYSYNTHIQNLKITRKNQISLFEKAQDFRINRLGISAVEFPIEIRWRNSTAQKFKFFRIYGGVKISYILSSKSTFRDDIETLTAKNIPEFDRIQYGLILASGFSTWNLYVYYGLNPFFKEVDFNGEKLNLKDLNIGLKFYIM